MGGACDNTISIDGAMPTTAAVPLNTRQKLAEAQTLLQQRTPFKSCCSPFIVISSVLAWKPLHKIKPHTPHRDTEQPRQAHLQAEASETPNGVSRILHETMIAAAVSQTSRRPIARVHRPLADRGVLEIADNSGTAADGLEESYD